MKKTASILAILCMSFMIFSCSKKDKTQPKNHEQLEITASSSEVIEGDEVEFTVTVGDENIAANIYINTDKISGTSYTFDKAGEYVVIAKKEGYPNSEGLKIIVKSPVIYLAGALQNANGTGTVSAYWKNGKWILLEETANNQTSMGMGVVEKDGDVYVAGFTGFGGGQPPKAVYWKNGSKHELGEGMALGITLDEGKIYIAGATVDANGDSHAVYWTLDGQKNVIEDNSIAAAIAVEKGTVYTAGIVQLSGNPIVAYWKDKERIPLQYQGNEVSMNVIGGFSFPPMSLVLHQGEVYVTYPYNPEDFDGKALIWKNGEAEELPAGGDAGAFTLTESDGELYAAGIGEFDLNDPNSQANFVYWKNGSYKNMNESAFVLQYLTLIPSSMTVYNGKMYMAGGGSGTPVGFLWKDGELKTLMELNGQQNYTMVNDIFVGRE